MYKTLIIGRNGIRDCGKYYWGNWMIYHKGERVKARRVGEEFWVYSLKQDCFLGKAYLIKAIPVIAEFNKEVLCGG